jgi:hypothetical protein
VEIDGAQWRTITVPQPDGTRIEYGFFPSAESGHVPAFVARCRRTAAGDWTPVEFWDAKYSDAPAPEIPPAVWAALPGGVRREDADAPASRQCSPARRPIERRGAAPPSARQAWLASGAPERRRTA